MIGRYTTRAKGGMFFFLKEFSFLEPFWSFFEVTSLCVSNWAIIQVRPKILIAQIFIIFMQTFGVILVLFCLINVAIASETESAEVWFNKGVDLYEQGKYEDALECFDKAIELDPDFSDAWYNKGLVLQYLGREEEAQKCYEEAEKITDPKKDLIDAFINKIMDLFGYLMSMLKHILSFV